MPRYKNVTERILGLDPGPATGLGRTVRPGVVFESEANKIPQSYLQLSLLTETEEPLTFDPEWPAAPEPEA